MELQPLVRHLARWGWLIVFCAVAAGALGGLVSRQLPPVYRATTTVLVSERAGAGAGDRQTSRNELLVETYVQLLHRRPILDAIIARLSLPIRAETLERRLQARGVPNTQMITISAQAGSAEAAAMLANTAAAELGARGPQLIGSLWRRTTLDVVAPAVTPIRPVTPWVPLNVALATVLGALTSAGVLVVRRLLVRTVETPADLRAETDLTPLASIPAADRHRAGNLPVLLHNPHAPAAEAYRTLRAQVLPRFPADRPWSLAITSAAGGEGKSAVAANLAIGIAQTGRRVVLVDAQLRRPLVHTLFGQRAAGAPGLAAALQTGSADLEGLLAPTAVPQLRLLSAGAPVALPAELLASAELRALIARLCAIVDVVIVDCGPALAVADGLEAARACDAALLVARFGSSRVADVIESHRQIVHVGVRVIGTVVTAVRGPRWKRSARPVLQAPRAPAQVGEAEPQTVGD